MKQKTKLKKLIKLSLSEIEAWVHFLNECRAKLTKLEKK